MKPLKVFIVQKILNFAGSEIYLLQLLPALRKQGIDAHFGLLCDDEGAPVTIQYKEKLVAAQVPVFVFNLNKIPSLTQLKQISKHVKDESYDLVHTHLLLADMCFALIKTFFLNKLVIVSTKHGYNEAYNNKHGFQIDRNEARLYRLIAKFTEKKIQRSFAVSKALRNLFIGLQICDPDKVDVIYHGFDYPDVSYNSDNRFAENQVVIVGRLTAFKGHRFAIQAMPEVLREVPSAKLIIVGDGLLREELQALAQQTGVSEHVIFSGFHPNPREVVATSDVVVLPSVAEAFGLVILETMSAKVPLVAFDVPTPSELLRHEETAMIAPAFDTLVLARHIIRLLTDKKLRNRIAENAYNKQKAHFSLASMIDQTISFYKKALDKTIS